MEVRIAKIEQQLEDHIQTSRDEATRNQSEHSLILTRLEKSMTFQNRLQWVGGTVLLMLGSIIGWMIHNWHLLWDAMPKHGH